jgi:hypothetical protein
MKTIKQLLSVVLIGLLMVSVAMAQEKASQTAAPGPTTVYQAKFQITLQSGEYDLQTIIMDFPQGVGVRNHVHGGYVLVTVLNGEMTLLFSPPKKHKDFTLHDRDEAASRALSGGSGPPDLSKLEPAVKEQKRKKHRAPSAGLLPALHTFSA